MCCPGTLSVTIAAISGTIPATPNESSTAILARIRREEELTDWNVPKPEASRGQPSAVNLRDNGDAHADTMQIKERTII